MSKRLVANVIPDPVEEPPPPPVVVKLSDVFPLPDTRSPVERFRTKPQKAFSVTDLVSPAWCELQYWYTLTKHGRKRRTPAMRQGTAVHTKLEREVHQIVRVDARTPEDKWGLRIRNVIQGLRTLRSTGLTRELEVWGTVDGHVVNGIIDELSFIHPDTALEESAYASSLKGDTSPDQSTLFDFYKSSGNGGSLATAMGSKRRSNSNKIYICDVKTRGIKRLPSKGAENPAKMQLMLYHQFLGLLATDTVDLSILAARYNLDLSRKFSDDFIAQLMSLDEASYDSIADASQTQYEQIFDWSMSGLWAVMINELKLTLPEGDASLGNVLKVEYRARSDGEIIGSTTFMNDKKALARFIDHEMEWWRGNRKAEGVSIEDSYKCFSCDFKDTCEWREAQHEILRNSKVEVGKKRA